jgi:type VI secretion system protein ImpA
MPAVDFESLSKPVSAEAPCGSDLEQSGDVDYMNFIAGAEGMLPKSYFGKDKSGNEGRPFDRTSIDFEAQFNAAKPFLEKTRDLRLLGILAKFCILNRDLAGFIACIRAMSALLAAHWEDVHPRSEDGDFSFRMIAIEAIDALPTVVIPLQFLPLVEHQRLGTVSYRGYMIAKGEVKPSEGEEAFELSTIERALHETELPTLVEKRQQLIDLEAALKQIHQVWQEKCVSGPTIDLARLPASVAQIFAMLDAAIAERDPGASLAGAIGGGKAGAAGSGLDTLQPGASASSGRVTSSAAAAGALKAVAIYFSRSEPSNPALLLVRQANDLLGKSFLEVLQVLVPDHVAKAAVNIGKDQVFDLPIERLSTFATEANEQPVNQADPEAAGDLHFEAQSRTDALALLEQVGNYLRRAEPSSPIPFLTDSARDLAQRDFLSVLKALLPPDSLRDSTKAN